MTCRFCYEYLYHHSTLLSDDTISRFLTFFVNKKLVKTDTPKVIIAAITNDVGDSLTIISNSEPALAIIA